MVCGHGLDWGGGRELAPQGAWVQRCAAVESQEAPRGDRGDKKVCGVWSRVQLNNISRDVSSGAPLLVKRMTQLGGGNAVTRAWVGWELRATAGAGREQGAISAPASQLSSRSARSCWCWCLTAPRTLYFVDISATEVKVDSVIGFTTRALHAVSYTRADDREVEIKMNCTVEGGGRVVAPILRRGCCRSQPAVLRRQPHDPRPPRCKQSAAGARLLTATPKVNLRTCLLTLVGWGRGGVNCTFGDTCHFFLSPPRAAAPNWLVCADRQLARKPRCGGGTMCPNPANFKRSCRTTTTTQTLHPLRRLQPPTQQHDEQQRRDRRWRRLCRSCRSRISSRRRRDAALRAAADW